MEDMNCVLAENERLREVVKAVEKLRDRWYAAAESSDGPPIQRLSLMLSANEIDFALGGSNV